MKDFDRLTIVDDYMFCTVMEDTQLCKELLSMVLKINNPDASVGVCCSHKVVAVGFNTLCYDASVGILNPRIIKS